MAGHLFKCHSSQPNHKLVHGSSGHTHYPNHHAGSTLHNLKKNSWKFKEAKNLNLKTVHIFSYGLAF